MHSQHDFHEQKFSSQKATLELYRKAVAEFYCFLPGKRYSG